MKLPVDLFVKALAIVLFAPLFQGFIKRLKGILQGRKGPPILQPYRDFFKYCSKRMVFSRQVSWVFHAAPIVSFSAVFTAALMVPWIDKHSWGFFGDILLFVYLLAIPRFMLSLAGLDASGAFGGMASSREMAVSALAEPALLLSLLTLALPARSLRLENLMTASGDLPFFTPAGLFAALAFYLILIAEVGRIPVDNPDTHLELTMIHEGMVLEYSGPQFALLNLTHWIKQITLVILMFNSFAPIGMLPVQGEVSVAALYLSGKLIIGGFLLAHTESFLIKLRLFQMMDLMGLSFVFSLTSLVFVSIGR